MAELKALKKEEIAEGVFLSLLEGKNGNLIDLRKFYQTKEGEWQPTRKGICLDLQSWSDIKAILLEKLEEFGVK